MPARYFIFSTLVLGTALGASKLIADMQAPVAVEKKQIVPAAVAEELAVEANTAKTISGSSIAPGGAGGRQSQFSAVLGDSNS
jgi:hypothetical protein